MAFNKLPDIKPMFLSPRNSDRSNLSFFDERLNTTFDDIGNTLVHDQSDASLRNRYNPIKKSHHHRNRSGALNKIEMNFIMTGTNFQSIHQARPALLKVKQKNSNNISVATMANPKASVAFGMDNYTLPHTDKEWRKQ